MVRLEQLQREGCDHNPSQGSPGKKKKKNKSKNLCPWGQRFISGAASALSLSFSSSSLKKKVSYKVAQASIRLAILLPQHLKCEDCRFVPPHLVTFDFFQGTFGDGELFKKGTFQPSRRGCAEVPERMRGHGGYAQDRFQSHPSEHRTPPPLEFVMCLEVAFGDKGSRHTHTRIWSGET